jgi:hypothetical protein
MFVVMVSVTARDGEELTRRVQTGLAPILKRNPGFRGYHSIDAGDDRRVGVIMFETREDAEAAREAAQEWVQTSVVPLGGKPEMVMGDVIFSIRPDTPGAQPQATSGAEARPH